MRIALIAVLLFIAGCATTNFRNAIGGAYLAIDAVATTVTEECGNVVPDGPCVAESAISTEEKQELKSKLIVATDAVDDARRLYIAGSADLASSQLKQAQRLVGAVEDILIARGVE